MSGSNCAIPILEQYIPTEYQILLSSIHSLVLQMSCCACFLKMSYVIQVDFSINFIENFYLRQQLHKVAPFLGAMQLSGNLMWLHLNLELRGSPTIVQYIFTIQQVSMLEPGWRLFNKTKLPYQNFVCFQKRSLL